MKANTIYNESCLKTLERIEEEGKKVSLILTSPPYNTGRNSTSERGRGNYEARYDVHLDNMTDREYCDFTLNLFEGFDKVLRKNGVILYNMSYSSDMQNVSDTYKPHEIMFRTVSTLLEKSSFTLADTIIWKKPSALPNNASSNRLTRICEFVFVFVREEELRSFKANKQVKSVSSRGQNFYENVFNFVEAKNNDGAFKLNKATYSTELCHKLLDIYADPSCKIVYGPFMGSGTTAVACAQRGLKFIGSEISEAQCAYALERVREVV